MEAILRERRCESVRILYLLAHPPSRTYPITVHSSRVEKARTVLEGDHTTSIRQETPESRCGSPSLEVEQPSPRLSRTRSTHVKVQRVPRTTSNKKPPKTQITQKQAQRQSTKTGQNHTTPKDHTERDAERHADAETETEAPEKSHEVHLGEGANTGAQLPAREDRKLSVCLRVPASRRRIGCWRRERGGSQISLTRCISAKVQTRVHNFQPERRRPKT